MACFGTFAANEITFFAQPPSANRAHLFFHTLDYFLGVYRSEIGHALAFMTEANFLETIRSDVERIETEAKQANWSSRETVVK